MMKKRIILASTLSVFTVGVFASVVLNSNNQLKVRSFANGVYTCELPAGYSELSSACQTAMNANADVTNTYRLRGTVTRSVSGTTYIQRVNQVNGELDGLKLVNGGNYSEGNVLDISGGKLNKSSGVPYLDVSTATVTVSFSTNQTGYEPRSYDSVSSFMSHVFSDDTYPYSHYVQLNNVKVAFSSSSNLFYLADAENESNRALGFALNDTIKNSLNDYHSRESILSIKGVLSNEDGNDVLKIVKTADITLSSSPLRSPQKTTILQAWNWNLTNITNELANIRDAGFKTIQISPLQPQKDYYNGDTWQNQWWKLYQPLGFKVSDGNNESIIGTKSQLQTLTSRAKEYGINIIVDVVCNHLAGDNAATFSSGVKNYENYIYSNGGETCHSYGGNPSDDNSESVVRGHVGGYPDLNTANSTVQNRVIAMLKDYVDCGVRGFRFDAAKHIETPSDDQSLRSDFWPNVTNAVASYAQNKYGFTPYQYGEIMGPGHYRSYSWYTPYMSITDNGTIYDIRSAVTSNDLNSVSNNFTSGCSANQIVVWPESHDEYQSGATSGISQDTINKIYAVYSSRNDLSTLFLARPNNNTQMGAIGTTAYKSNVVKACNTFHNELVNASEYIKRDNGYFMNIRKGSDVSGAIIVNISGSGSGTIDLGVDGNFMIPDGQYKELITGNTVTVSNGRVNATFTNGVMVLLGNFAKQSGFGIKLNGRPIMGFDTGETDYQGRTQYSIYNQTFHKDDTFTLYDFSTKASWVIDVDEFSFDSNVDAYLTKGASYYTVKKDFVADVYIKIKSGDDQIYFGLKDMTLSRDSVTVTVGNNTTVTASGWIGNSLSATSSNPSIVTASVNNSTITINGVATGSATITVTDGVFTKYISVTVSAQQPVSSDITIYFAGVNNWDGISGVNVALDGDWHSMTATTTNDDKAKGQYKYVFTAVSASTLNFFFQQNNNTQWRHPTSGSKDWNTDYSSINLNAITLTGGRSYAITWTGWHYNYDNWEHAWFNYSFAEI